MKYKHSRDWLSSAYATQNPGQYMLDGMTAQVLRFLVQDGITGNHITYPIIFYIFYYIWYHFFMILFSCFDGKTFLSRIKSLFFEKKTEFWYIIGEIIIFLIQDKFCCSFKCFTHCWLESTKKSKMRAEIYIYEFQDLW